MKNKISAAFAALCLTVSPLEAQDLKTTTWSSFGVSFKAPSDITIEDDSEEGYIVSTPTYYITVQLLEGEGLKQSELASELKNIATDDEITEQSSVTEFELPQFYGVRLQGNCDTEQCLYCYLLAKDESCGFYVSITYREKNDKKTGRHTEQFQTGRITDLYL